jgi:outer membrane biosynthesis protein TonB
MKKLFLALLCAGLFFACGNKKTAEEPAVDTTACQEQVVDEPEVVAEPEVAEAAEAPAQEPKANTTSKPKPKPTVQQHAQQAAENVANAAIDQAESNATQQIQSKKRR